MASLVVMKELRKELTDCVAFVVQSTQPASAEDHRQAQKDGQAGPGDAVQGRFGAAGTAEHRAATGCQATHAIPLGAMEQHQNDQ